MKHLLWGLIVVMAAGAQPYTRGVGIYPGDPRENFAATLVSGGQRTVTWRCTGRHTSRAHMTTT
jgi:hypothetical protein